MPALYEKRFATPLGSVCYWTSWAGAALANRATLVFLPGLTATHRLFERQLDALADEFDCLAWDPPSHGASRPFALSWRLEDMAEFLFGILQTEGVTRPVLVGQSMGGYVAQMLMELHPGCAGGFVSIDSVPLKRRYSTGFDLWALRRTEPLYRLFPWKLLLAAGSAGCATSAYGRSLMRSMMDEYGRDEYCRLAGHGFSAIADAIAADRAYRVDCPALLMCGDEDAAGSTKRYNKRWAAGEDLPLYWVAGAGHNANTDAPDEVSALIRAFVAEEVLTSRDA
ncbi:alpha/beta fold hydrolase [Rubneribacter sp.]|nr:alpha/beta hydrolase [Candidatus Rubneribacter avistercoris]